MSAPILSFHTAHARRPGISSIRLRLKPAHRSCGSVQGAWWPRTDQLHTGLPLLLAALWPRVGSVDRVIYDETSWAPAALQIQFRGQRVILEASATTSTNTLSLIGDGPEQLVLLAAAALVGLALLGPRRLNETDIRTQTRTPLPHTAKANNATNRRTDPVSDPAAPAGVVDIFFAPSAIFATQLTERSDDPPTMRARAQQRIPTSKARAELETK